jgi:hypothetical protein
VTKSIFYRVMVYLPLLFFHNAIYANIGTPQVTVTPNQTNTYASYTINTVTGYGDTDLRANVDSIIIVFNASTQLPLTIDPSLVTVNNTASNAVSVSGQRVAILTPVYVEKNGRGSITVVIDVSAEIQNPSSAANYTLQAATTRGQDTPLITSNPYTISASSSTVTAAAVTPNPSVAGESASYTIGFNVGSAGFLTANVDNIMIAFPALTTVPDGILSGVTVNGTTAFASASNDTVTITTPVTINNNGPVEVVFAVGAGLQNPSTEGYYNINVQTSAEQTYVISDMYGISAVTALSITSITSKPEMVNQSGEFKFNFRTSSSGALAANNDTIGVLFQQNSFIPSDLSLANVSISSGGFSDNAAAISVLKSDATDDDSVLITTPINVGNSSDVELTLSSTAGYLNPSVAGNYSLRLYTSQDTGVVQSNPYAVANTTTKVSQALVTPANNAVSAVTSYTVNFNLGSLGRLKPGESTITLTFNSAYTLQTDPATYYNACTIAVGGETPVAIPTANISANNTAKTVQITVPVSVITSNGENIVLVIAGSSNPIQNPAAPNNYVLGVKTSVEASNVNSLSYNIGGTPITIHSVTVATPNVNDTSQYSFNITVQKSMKANDNDWVRIVFPQGTSLPAIIATSNMTIQGVQPSLISINQGTRTLTANIGANINASANFDVIISQAANIINPVIPSSSFYKVTMNTSQDLVPVTSAAYTISGNNTQVTSVSGTAAPAVINATNIAFTVYFTTSSVGKIAGGQAAGSSTITVDFDSSTIIPSSITASTVGVNSIPCTEVSVIRSDSGGVVEITVPNGVTINNSTAAVVQFNVNAGLDNGSTAGTYNLTVKTSSDTVYSSKAGTEGDYTLTESQDLYIVSVTPNPATQNAAASYSVKFTTGSSGALAPGDSIHLLFPSNTYIPGVINKNDITVNGTSLSGNPAVLNDTVMIIRTPVTIANLTAVTVLINQSSGILNPTTVKSYRLKLMTSAEAGPFLSPLYNITQTSTTVSAAEVMVDNPAPNERSMYTIEFSTGGNGKLNAGTGTITATFNNSTTVDGTADNYDSTYIYVDGVYTEIPEETHIAVDGKAVTFTVPSGVSIDNNDNVGIIINRIGSTDPILNPVANGEYTLQVRTSIETTNITSNSYVISDAPPVTNITVSLSPNIANAASADTVTFQVQNALTGGSGTVTIRFPFNTYVPVSMSTANVRVASAASNPTSFSDASAVAVSPATRTVTITVPNDVTATHYVRVAFLSGAGLQNPSIYGNYTLQVRTSAQPLYSTSASYNVAASNTMISDLHLTITPGLPDTLAEHRYEFYTGSRGRLVSGVSTIYLLIPYNGIFDFGAPATSKVTVNSTAAAAVQLIEDVSGYDTLIVTVPASVTIGNSSQVTVIIDETAGLRTPATTYPPSYLVYTSVETTVTSIDVALPVSLLSFTASCIENKVILDWITSSELFNAHWLVERKELSAEEVDKINSSQLTVMNSENPFERISKIEGQGNTSEETQYSFIDGKVEQGKVYAYRLADVSFNGSVNYHDPLIQDVPLPKTYALEQNYPNPFNPVTMIKYQLPAPSRVKLKIYNILGQEIKKLVDENIKAGNYKIQWDGKNEHNRQVASGIYIYRIEVKSLDGKQKFSKSLKMINLK